ncbi:MAG TPA: hypothetical protein VNB24_06055 [Acidimicrobiales bacterium]|nr:hypothetical protein [Acidimicrobiales bacterium]
MTILLNRRVSASYRAAFAGLSTLLLGLPLGASGSTQPSAAPPFTFSPSGLVGGGFVNVVAADPRDNGLLLAGSDTGGIQRSTDGGQHWSAVNSGVTIGGLAVAALAFDPTRPGTAFAALGELGAGGVVRTEDDGKNWTVRSTVPVFEARSGAPRPTGRLLAFNAGSLFAGTLNGVMRSGDDGATWTNIAPTSVPVRGLAVGTGPAPALFAALGSQGVLRVDDPNGAARGAVIAASPPAEELAVTEDGSIVAAAGTHGMSISTDSGATWRRAPLPGGTTATAAWLSVSTRGSTVVAGAANPTRDSLGWQSVIASEDAGATWRSLTSDRTLVHGDQIGGPGGKPWWLSAGAPSFQIGRSGYIASDLAFSNGNLISAGRSGMWIGRDGGANWYPSVDGLGVTVVRQLALDPGSGEIHAALADWVLRSSTDRMRTPSGGPPGNASSGHAVAQSRDVTVLGLGHNLTNTGGDLWLRDLSGWRSTGLGLLTNGRRVTAVSAQHTSAGALIVLAAVERGGMWRMSDNAWTRVSDIAAMGPARGWGGSIAWSGASVFYFDRDLGVFRSLDSGHTWTRWFAKKSPWPVTGYVAVDPSRPGRLYASVGFDALYRFDGAESGSAAPVRLAASSVPGPVTVTPDGRVLLATLGIGGAPRLLESANAGGNWSDVADDRYRSTAVFPTSLALLADGGLAVGLGGNGILMGERVAEASLST